MKFAEKVLKNIKEKTFFSWITTIANEEDYVILKSGFHKAIKRYGTERQDALIDIDFWMDYSGLSREKIMQVNRILTKLVLSQGWTSRSKVIRSLMSVGLTRKQAETIARTELGNIANYTRILAYKKKTKVRLFKWKPERDACDVCKKIAERTKKGVTIDELKTIIKEVAGLSAREFLAHPNCRCVIVRKYEDKRWMKWWEKSRKVRVLVTRRDGVRQHYWISPNKLEQFRREHEARGEKVEVEGQPQEKPSGKLDLSNIKFNWNWKAIKKKLEGTNYVYGEKLFTLSGVIGDIKSINERYAKAKKFFAKHVSKEYADSLAKAWSVWYEWSVGYQGALQNTIDKMIAEYTGYRGIIRPKTEEDKEVEEFLKNVTIDDLLVYKKFVQDLIRDVFGVKDSITLYRGVGRSELVYLAFQGMIKGFSDEFVPMGNLASFSLLDIIAGHFGSTIIKVEVPLENIWGCFISSTPPFLDEYEFIAQYPRQKKLKYSEYTSSRNELYSLAKQVFTKKGRWHKVKCVLEFFDNYFGSSGVFRSIVSGYKEYMRMFDVFDVETLMRNATDKFIEYIDSEVYPNLEKLVGKRRRYTQTINEIERELGRISASEIVNSPVDEKYKKVYFECLKKSFAKLKELRRKIKEMQRRMKKK